MIITQGQVYYNKEGERKGIVEVGQKQGETLSLWTFSGHSLQPRSPSGFLSSAMWQIHNLSLE